MKKIFYIMSLASFIFTGSETFAQLRKIPAEVTTALSQKYPGATNVEWRDRLSGFSASFTLDSNSYIASFGNKGEWENTEQTIDQDELPEIVEDGFQKSRYTDWT